MKTFITLLVFLISSIAFGATAQVNSVYGVGQVDTASGATVPIGDKSLLGFTINGAVTTSGYCAPLLLNGVAYQVPSGKTLRIIRTIQASASGANQWEYASATATFAWNTAPASLTGPVYETGVSNNYSRFSPSTTYTWIGDSVIHEFTQNTWPGECGNVGGVMFLHAIGFLY